MLGFLSGAGMSAMLLAVLVAAFAFLSGDRLGSKGQRRVLVAAAVSLVVGSTLLIYTHVRSGSPVAVAQDVLVLAGGLALVTGKALRRSAPARHSIRATASSGIDQLTRVASHRAFQDRLVHECEHAYRFGDSFALLMLNLDQFRLVNKRLGHKAGDEILTQLARRLKAQIREIDLCARFGGDQFALILPQTPRGVVEETAERLRQSISTWVFATAGGGEAMLTASIGLALCPHDGKTAHELVEAAKEAARLAKSLGGNQVQLFRDLPLAAPTPGNVFALPVSPRATIVRSLAAAVDVRDRYTHSHSRLVSELSEATAWKIGLSSGETSQIKIGALLHDVGKIGVPDAILSKRGTLTPEEWDSVREHPQLGKTIIEQAPELTAVVPLVFHHQEWFDGAGYPTGLRGADIPLGARIIAAADAYYAIRSDRPYRSGRTHEDAVQEIIRCSGSQFDPHVVSALIGVLESERSLRSLSPEDRPVSPQLRRRGGGRHSVSSPAKLCLEQVIYLEPSHPDRRR